MTQASPEQTLVQQIESSLLEVAGIDRVMRVTVFELDRETVIVGARISLPAEMPMRKVSVAVTLAERRIERLVPAAKHIYVTPDVYLDDSGSTPSTSTIVTLSYD